MQHLLFGLMSAVIGLNILAFSAAQEKGILPTFDHLEVADVIIEDEPLYPINIPVNQSLLETSVPSTSPIPAKIVQPEKTSNHEEHQEVITTVTPTITTEPTPCVTSCGKEVSVTPTPTPTSQAVLTPKAQDSLSPTVSHTPTPSPTPLFSLGASMSAVLVTPIQSPIICGSYPGTDKLKTPHPQEIPSICY